MCAATTAVPTWPGTTRPVPVYQIMSPWSGLIVPWAVRPSGLIGSWSRPASPRLTHAGASGPSAVT
ncbi:hypothetical protein [Ornithinimicrobium kibberense]|uniref:hypothetical protein n=1 Tax=Ornithinimicrobium kibberense TaxID=282060 RepID=UPI003614A3C8